MENEQLNLKNLIAITMSDVDIFLLQNEEQTGDNDKESFTREEVRSQLRSTMGRVCDVLIAAGYNIEQPLLWKHIRLTTELK